MDGTEALPLRPGAHAGWSGLGRFSSDPMWHPVSLYPVGDALLVHRRRAGIIAELRRSSGGEVLVDQRTLGIVLVTLQDTEGIVGRVLLGPRTHAVDELRVRGWLRGVAAEDRSYGGRS